MTDALNPQDPEDPRVFEIVEQYLSQLEAGQPVNRREFESRFPELAGEIATYLDAIEMLNAAAPNLRDSGVTSRSGQSDAPSAITGEPLGDFQLLREIGRGGMGMVYEAIQLSLGRKVAVKVLPFAAALDSRQLQRFRNEAQAAAVLHHPHIVPVYGVGCERGVHFYVMQLIEGQNLAGLINELRSERGVFPETDLVASESQKAGAATLSPRQAFKVETVPAVGEHTSRRAAEKRTYYRTLAEMMAQAADGLEYAHSLGIVHRDVKPANILVDRSGSVWVADFGLAQIQTDHLLTQTGDLLGTLRYMSPEQASGQVAQVDQRSDVYSLGATFYELLTLRPLFEATHRRALFREILEEDPPSPRSIEKSVPRELEIIAMKALEKVPGERYASAGAMRDDLRRFLNDIPIQARPPSVRDRLAKWSRRHRGVVASAVVALILTVAGLSVATWMTAAAYDRERARAVEAAMQFERAEQNFRQARAAVDEFTRLGEETLGDHPQLETARIRILEAALSYYQTFADQQTNDPALHAELEMSLAKVEQILDELNTLVGALRYTLLLDPVVQRDLKLTDEQLNPIEAYDREWRETLRESSDLPRAEREQKRIDLARRQDLEVKRLLTPQQQHRLQQIIWIDAGPGALNDSVLANALDLTLTQRTEIRRLLDTYMTVRPGGPPMRPPPEFGRRPEHRYFDPPDGRPPEPPPPPGPGPEFSPAVEEIIRAELKSILTPQQTQRWAEMLGEPLAGPLRRRGPQRSHFRVIPEEKEQR